MRPMRRNCDTKMVCAKISRRQTFANKGEGSGIMCLSLLGFNPWLRHTSSKDWFSSFN